MNKSWTVHLETDENGELVLPLTDEMLEGTGIGLGDTVEWIDNGNGSWSIKKQECEWVLVDAISTFRMRYMVQVPKGKSEWALDTVVCQEAKEFSQEHIGEQIVSHRVLTEQEALAVCDVDNDYLKSWTDEQKINTFFTKQSDLK